MGLVLQLFAIILLPLTLLLIAITFGSLAIHNQAMRNMVGERDASAVRAAAAALNAQIEGRTKLLDVLAAASSTQSPPSNPDLLNSIDSLASDYDAGLVIFDGSGVIRELNGDRQVWQDLTSDSAWAKVYTQLKYQPGKLVITNNPRTGEHVGLLSAETGSSNFLVGAFSIDKLVGSTLGESLPYGAEMSILLAGSDGQILYHTGDLPDQSPDHPGIAQALQGQSGIMYVKVGGDEHVTAYSPVSAAGLGLVTEESWQALATPTLRASQITPLMLVPAVLIMLVALWFGLSQVVKPLQALETQTATLAKGDFRSIRQPVGGISEVRHLQDGLIQMADKVEEAQRSLHGYIGAITEAQEDERQRLARELHDDTLQALIALKQRVQLTQLEQVSAGAPATPQTPKLGEVVGLIEQTIENLRRLTRAMRPAYLEDLGLVPALEVLAREASQGMGFTVEFHHQGNEIRLDASKELALYRIAQETLSNIARHAQARHASLSITYLPQSVQLQVDDDGTGFIMLGNTSEYAAEEHYGLLGMHERAELIGAALQVRSAPGRGTTITVTLPVQAEIFGEKGE